MSCPKNVKVKVYEVYQCKYKGEIVYVGQGSKGRHKHCNSGISHVFALNEVYFREGCDALTVEVIHLSNDKEAVLAAEKYYIQKYQPAFNSTYTYHQDRNSKANEGKEVKKMLLDAKYLEELDSKRNVKKYKDLVEEFYDYFGYKALVSGDIHLYGYKHYKSIDKGKIALLSRHVRLIGRLSVSQSNPYMLFYRVLIDVFNIDLRDCLMSCVITSLKWARGEIKDEF